MHVTRRGLLSAPGSDLGNHSPSSRTYRQERDTLPKRVRDALDGIAVGVAVDVVAGLAVNRNVVRRRR